MTDKIILNLSCLFSLLLLLACKQSPDKIVDVHVIKAGTAKITGRIRVANHTKNDDILVNITVPHPVSGENVQYQANVDRSGKFSVNIDVETDISLIVLNTSLYGSKSLLVKLKSGGLTNIDIAYNSDNGFGNISVVPAGMTRIDMIRGLEDMDKMIDYSSGKKHEPLYNKSTDYFLEYVKSTLSERLAIVNSDTSISKGLREILAKDYRVSLYSTFVFDYEKYMTFNYRNTNGDRSGTPDIQKIDRSYYRFLRDLYLDDRQYLYCLEFPKVQQAILQNQILGLPVIGEGDIPSWLAKVKAILSDLLGFRDGQYYDMLAANAYGQQLTKEVRPLSAKQKKNISDYWKNGEVAKILLRKNQTVVEIARVKSAPVVNDISSVPRDKVIETITGKYKNKVVLIDFWATWCAPCIEAMQQFRSTKSGFHDKDVVFVYLTNGSSPRALWEEKIKGIGNEHYYLKGDQWEYVMSQFELKYIPSYLIYNRQGKFISKFTGFPGNDKLKDLIDDLL